MFGNALMVFTDKTFLKKCLVSLGIVLMVSIVTGFLWALPSSPVLDSFQDRHIIPNLRTHLSSMGIKFLLMYLDTCIIYVLVSVTRTTSLALTNFDEVTDLLTVSRAIFRKFFGYLTLAFLFFGCAVSVLYTKVRTGMPIENFAGMIFLAALCFGHLASTRAYVLYGTMTNQQRSDYFLERSMTPRLVRLFLKKGREYPRLYMWTNALIFIVVGLPAALLQRFSSHDHRNAVLYALFIGLAEYVVAVSRRIWDVIKPFGQRESLWIHTESYRVREPQPDVYPGTQHELIDSDRSVIDQSHYNFLERQRRKEKRKADFEAQQKKS